MARIRSKFAQFTSLTSCCYTLCVCEMH